MRKGEKRPDLQRARIGSCAVCSKEFRAVKDYHAKQQKYCSKACWSIRGSHRQVKSCEVCQKEFQSRHARRFCSFDCKWKGLRGPGAPAWKDGKSLERDRARLGPELARWRIAVYERDGYTCQHCAAKQNLHAHHIKEWSTHPDLRFEVSNGLTLCARCHGIIHGKDFSNRRVKKCSACQSEITGKGGTGMCRSCSISQWHRSRQPKWSELNGTPL